MLGTLNVAQVLVFETGSNFLIIWSLCFLYLWVLHN